jgi:hypothetical protein
MIRKRGRRRRRKRNDTVLQPWLKLYLQVHHDA